MMDLPPGEYIVQAYGRIDGADALLHIVTINANLARDPTMVVLATAQGAADHAQRMFPYVPVTHVLVLEGMIGKVVHRMEIERDEEEEPPAC